LADDWLGISSAEYDSHCGDDGTNTIETALDGTRLWKHAVDEDHWFILDLGSTHTIKKFRGRSNSIGNDPLKIDIYVSDSKTEWGAAVATDIDTWQDTDEWVEVDSTDKDGRYIKVVIKDTEAANRYLDWRAYDGGWITIFDAYGDVAGGVEHTHSASDTMAISDSLSPALTMNVALQDTHAIGDSLATPVMTFNVALDDTLAISDSLAVAATYNVALADTLNMSDSLLGAATYAVALADTLGISDSLAVAATYSVALADTMTMSDALLAGWVLYVSLSDTMEMSDSMTYETFVAVVRKIRRGQIYGLKPARPVNVGRIGV